MKSGKYNFSYNAVDNVSKKTYSNSYALTYVKKRYSIFIYTDKMVYKRGDLLRYTLFAVDSETLPFNVTSSTIDILSPDYLKVQSLKNSVFVNGKFKGTLQLSKSAPLGLWLINVTTPDVEVNFLLLIKAKLI